MPSSKMIFTRLYRPLLAHLYSQDEVIAPAKHTICQVRKASIAIIQLGNNWRRKFALHFIIIFSHIWNESAAYSLAMDYSQKRKGFGNLTNVSGQGELTCFSSFLSSQAKHRASKTNKQTYKLRELWQHEQARIGLGQMESQHWEEKCTEAFMLNPVAR